MSRLILAILSCFLHPGRDNKSWSIPKMFQLAATSNLAIVLSQSTTPHETWPTSPTLHGNMIVKYLEQGWCSDESNSLPPGFTPRLGVKCGLSLLVLYSTPTGFLRVLPFPLSSKTKLQFDYNNYYIHLEITADPCNLIGSQQCDLFTNHTIFCSKSHHFPSQ